MFGFFSKKKSNPPKKEIKPIVHNKSLCDKLIFNPEQFSFVKAIDVAVAITKKVEIKAKVNYSSKFSDISVVEGIKDGIAEIYTNIQGIAGIEGILPDCYVEEYITYNRASKKAVSDFFDIFNDRILSLRYKFMKRHDLSALSVPIEKSVIGNIIFSLSGFGFEKKHEKFSNSLIPEQFKISCQNLFWQNTRSSEGLRVMLSSFFDIPVKIKQFSGGFVEIDKLSQTSIGNKKNKFNELGKNSILGNKIWNESKGIDIIVGPLNFDTYTKFLPKPSSLDQKTSQLQKMKEIIKTYVPFGLDVKIHFYLDKCFVKETFLNAGKRLNKDSFIVGTHNSQTTHFIEAL